MSSRVARNVVLVVGMSLGLAACGKYSISNLRALKAFGEANKLYQKADYKAAAARYEDVIQYNPNFGYAYFFLGNSYDNQFKPARKGEAENDAYLQKAVTNYRLATEKLTPSVDPQGDPAKLAEYRKLSYEYLMASYGSEKLNDLTQAEPVAKQLIEMEPNEPASYQAMGKLYEDSGRYDEAEAMFKKAIAVKPNDPYGYQVMAGFYNRQGDFEKTMDAFQARANLEPNNPEAWHTMSTYYQEKAVKDATLSTPKKQEYIKKAIEDDDKALALNAEYADALIYKNILLRMQANYEKDPAVQKKLLNEADVLRQKGLELQKKQNAAGGRKGGG
jgi:tetratricopeptide (TPR) repeat protein